MAVEDEEGGPMAVVGVGIGVLVTWLSIAATLLLASDQYLVAGLRSGSAPAQDGGMLGIMVLATILFTIAPFLAVAMWGSVHGVTVFATNGAGTAGIEPVPLVGVVDGGLEPFAILLLLVVGVVTASEVSDSPIGQLVGGSVLGLAGYAASAWLLMMVSALAYNLFADVLNSLLATWVGVAGDVELAPMVVYPDTVGAFVQLATFAGPFVAAGAVVNAAVLFLTTDRPNPEPVPETGSRQSDVERSASVAETTDGDTASEETATDDPADETGSPTEVSPASDSGSGRSDHQGSDAGEGRWRDEWYEEDERRDGAR